MITHDKDGNLLFPEDYCKINNIQPLTPDDCYFYVNGNTSNVEEYFKNNFHNLEFTQNIPNFYVWRHCVIENSEVQKLINENEDLYKINNLLKISHALIMEFSVNSLANWHFDIPRKGPALNLLLTPNSHSYSLFTNDMFDISNLVECKYRPHQFVLYNTDMVHSVLNLDSVRYMFSFCFERGKTDLTWQEAKTLLSQI